VTMRKKPSLFLRDMFVLGAVIAGTAYLSQVNIGDSRPESNALTSLDEKHVSLAKSSMRPFKATYMAGDYLAARFALNNDVLDQAVRRFEKALAKEPGNMPLQERVVTAMVIAGKLDRAITLATSLMQKSNNEDIENNLVGNAKILVALDLFAKGEYSQVVDLLEAEGGKQKTGSKISISVGNLHALTLLLAWSKAELGQGDEALEVLNRYPRMGLTELFVFNKALISAISGNNKQAKKAFDALIPVTNSAVVLQYARAFYLHEGDEESVGRIDSLLSGRKHETKVISLAEKGHGREVVLRSFYDLAQYRYGRGDGNQAVWYLRLGMSLDETANDARLMLGYILQDRKLYQEANRTLRGIEKDSPDYWVAQVQIARNLYLMDDKEKAINRLQELAQSKADRAELWQALGEVQIAEEKFEEGIKAYNRAIEVVENDDKSSVVFKGQLYFHRGAAYERSDRWDLAESDLMKSLELQPDEPNVVNYLAYSWLIQGRHYDKAIELLKKAVEVRGEDAHILDSYGWALYKNGEFEEALVYLEKSNLMMPFSVEVNDHLGDVYWHLGRKTEAGYQWKRALSFDPDEDQAKLLQRKLSEGLTIVEAEQAKQLKTEEAAYTMPETPKVSIE